MYFPPAHLELSFILWVLSFFPLQADIAYKMPIIFLLKIWQNSLEKPSEKVPCMGDRSLTIISVFLNMTHFLMTWFGFAFLDFFPPYFIIWKLVVCWSRVRLFATPWTVARQAPLSMGFPRQEYWSGLPFPSPGGIFLTQGLNPRLLHPLHWQVDCFTTVPPTKSNI